MRLVSVLFVDLVGFTSLSERRDAEDVRELLSQYFAVARQVVGRHGGSIEKFIGDAVMAVWGAPLAHEDDALRAVRAALELVEGVSAFGARVGAPELRARGGIVTGRAASWASSSEGLVVGDRVNTASRVQSAAQPGTVLVDGLTREATDSQVEYRDAGSHQVKGKALPVHLFEAVRVMDRGARVEGGGFEPRATHGRDVEVLHSVEVFERVVSRRAAEMLVLSGEAGVGKSRVFQELTRYVDEIPTRVLWHEVGCTAYESGVAYWGLSRMVRQRLGVLDDDQPPVVAAKLEEGLYRYLPQEDDRAFAAPKLAVLLGQPGPEQPPSRDEFFAGWRTFIEGLARIETVVLAVENLQWADSGLLDFLEYLLRASAQLPILVVGMTRPELLPRRPSWADDRQVSLVPLGRLSDADLGALLRDLVPNMAPGSLRRVLDHAEGLPLYALETVHMLVARGLIQEQEGVLALTQELSEFDTPVSLEALIGARLDGLGGPEGALVKDLSILGLSFGMEAAGAVSSVPQAELAPLLDSLLAQGILNRSEDWRDIEGGGYTFTQTLLRTVAYERLGKRERRSRHLALANHLRSVYEVRGEAVAEPIADHYRDAYQSDPTAADSEEIRPLAREWLSRAAQRAASVGAPGRAATYLLQAAELEQEPEAALGLRESAAAMEVLAGRMAEALELFEKVAAEHAEAGRVLDAARLEGEIGQALGRLGRAGEATGRLRAALQVVEQGPPGPALAQVSSQLGRELSMVGEEAGPLVERALVLAQELDLPQVLCDAMETKALLLRQAGRPDEALALFERTVEIAEARGLSAEEVISGHANSADTRIANDLSGASAHLEAALALCRRLGQRYSETFLSGNLMLAQVFSGDWDGAMEVAAPLLQEQAHGQEILHSRLVLLQTLRGRPQEARAELERLQRWEAHDSQEPRTLYLALQGTVLLAEGRFPEALAVSRKALEVAVPAFGFRHEIARQAWPDACEAALRGQRGEEVASLLSLLEQASQGQVPPFLEAQGLRFRALTSDDGPEAACASASAAVEALARLGYPYWEARAILEWAGLCRRAGLEPPPALAQAEAELDRLQAGPLPDLAEVSPGS